MEQDPRSQERCIFHIDVNSAFLSWSAVKRLSENPKATDLRTIPSAVGGDVKTRHGIITAKSIPAKKYGVTTGEPVVKALQKCPQLVLIPSDFKTYRTYSKAFMDILHRYCPAVEQASIDEAYMDMTGLSENFAAYSERTGIWFPECAAMQIKNEIRDTLGFTVNVGISVNKLLAKTASDFEKPDRIHTLYPDELEEKFWPMPIDRLYGCGPATAGKLKAIGMDTIGEAAHADPDILRAILGEKAGGYIYKSANGISDSPVETEEEDARGYSNEMTTAVDITRENYAREMPPLIRELSRSVSRRLKRDGVRAFTVGVMVKTDSFKRHSRQIKLPDSTDKEQIIEKTAGTLMEQLLFGRGGLFQKGNRIRLAGVFATGLDRGNYHQISLMEALENMKSAEMERSAREKAGAEKKQRAALDDMMKKIRSRYGQDAVRKGAKPDADENNTAER